MDVLEEVRATMKRLASEEVALAPVTLSVQVVAVPKNRYSPLLQGYPEALEETVVEVPMELSSYRRLSRSFDAASTRELLVEVAAAALMQLEKAG